MVKDTITVGKKVCIYIIKVAIKASCYFNTTIPKNSIHDADHNH